MPNSTDTPVQTLVINKLEKSQLPENPSETELWIITDALDPQSVVLPTASEKYAGQYTQYTGPDTATLTSGYFYKCVAQGTSPETYAWEETQVQQETGSTYTAGDNITIENDVISATDTTYSAGGGIEITNNVIYNTGLTNTATGTNSLTVRGNPSSYNYTTNVGVGSTVSANYATSVGCNATASGASSTAVGYNSSASTLGTAVGRNSTVSSSYGTAVGLYASVDGSYSTAVGYYAKCTSSYNIQLGYGSNNSAHTLSVGLGTSSEQNYMLLDADGKVPSLRFGPGVAKAGYVQRNLIAGDNITITEQVGTKNLFNADNAETGHSISSSTGNISNSAAYCVSEPIALTAGTYTWSQNLNTESSGNCRCWEYDENGTPIQAVFDVDGDDCAEQTFTLANDTIIRIAYRGATSLFMQLEAGSEATAFEPYGIAGDKISATGGSSYTAGDGIDITNDVISVVEPVLKNRATKTSGGSFDGMYINDSRLSVTASNLHIGTNQTTSGYSSQTAIGMGASCTSNNGVAVGYNASANYAALAIGCGAVAKQRAIQLGCGGTNNESGTMSVTLEDANYTRHNYKLLDIDGTIPEARLADTTSATAGQVLTLDSNLNAVWASGGSGGGVSDVTVNGTSVVSGGVAAITVPTATSDLTNDSGFTTIDDTSTTSTDATWSASKLNTMIGDIETLINAL